MEDTLPKNYPSATPEISRILNISQDDSSHTVLHADSQFPSDLPVIDSEHKEIHEHPKLAAAHAAHDEVEQDIAALRKSAMPKFLKVVLPYLAVFAIGIFLYFFFFSKVDFSTLFKSKTATVQTPKETVLAQLEKQDAAEYNIWISNFYYSVSDAKIIDPDTDNSGNGLTNFEKYLLDLNPKSYDTLGLGRADSQTLAMGLNPLTGTALTDEQKTLVDKYIDMEVVMNRLTLDSLQNTGSVAGANTGTSIVYPSNTPTPTPVMTTQTSMVAPVTGADLLGNNIDVDQSIPGHLQIPSLKIDAPLTWTQDPKNFDTDLQSGVVHYPGTALPGQNGTAYISGHSSNYVWAKGNFNHVFTHLNDLADNTSFQITETDRSGKQYTLHYVVTGRHQYKPDDIAQFQNTGNSTVALSTCWPVGSTALRLVVFAKLTQID